MYADLKQAIVSLLTGNGALTQHLASSSAIYYSTPPQGRALPCLTYIIEDKPAAEADGHGRARLLLTIDIWSTSGDTNDTIMSALDDVLFDAHRAGGLDTNTWKVAACRRKSSEIAGKGGTDADLPIERRATHWHLEVMKKET